MCLTYSLFFNIIYWVFGSGFNCLTKPLIQLRTNSTFDFSWVISTGFRFGLAQVLSINQTAFSQWSISIVDNDSYVLLPHEKTVLLRTTSNRSKVDAKVGIYNIKWERNIVESRNL